VSEFDAVKKKSKAGGTFFWHARLSDVWIAFASPPMQKPQQ
jgi:hypothetical protein